MSDAIFSTPHPVTLIGGAEPGLGDFAVAWTLAPLFVAADGGADRALAAGIVPEAVIGDLDSISPEARAAIPTTRLHPVTEQTSTDFDKCLRGVVAPALLCVGFSGDRLDHALAALSSLVRSPQRALLLGAEDLCFHAPTQVSLDLPPGSRLSLFPMRPVTGRSTGLEWPIDALTLAPGGRIGTSNRVTGPVRLVFDGPGMLVITPREALAAAWRAMRAMPDEGAPR